MYPHTAMQASSCVLPRNDIGRRWFETSANAGRKITAGFTYMQRIGKSATFDTWFPQDLRDVLDAKRARGRAIGPKDFPAQWAAVRQFELLQDAGNYKIYDLKSDYLERTLTDLTRSMRGGGYRVTVATIGSYEKHAQADELAILDLQLQEGIAQMISMLYLDEMSHAANDDARQRLNRNQWDYREDLPHVGIVLGAGDLFRRLSDDPHSEHPRAKRQRHAKQFFDILSKLPSRAIDHQIAYGLQLPELIGQNQWIYIANPEETFASFNRLMTDIFSKFDGISLSALNGDECPRGEAKACSQHMRGYGDRFNEGSFDFYRSASLALN